MKKGLWVLLPLAVILSLYFSKIVNNSGIADVRETRESYMEGVRIVQKNKGEVQWELLAKRADIPDQGKDIELSGIVIKAGGQDMIVETEKAYYDLNTKRIYSHGTVVARDSSSTVTADNVELGNEGNLLKASGKVSITAKKYELRGKGLILDPGLQQIKVLSDVKAIFHN